MTTTSAHPTAPRTSVPRPGSAAGTARRMVAAEVLKLRRDRATTSTAFVLAVGLTALYHLVVQARSGPAGVDAVRALSSGSTLIALYFGAFAAMLVGATAGTADRTSGVLRDLVATGRSRTVLFLVRVPAAVAVALAFTLTGFAVTVAAACAAPGDAPGLGDVLRYGAWVACATTVVTLLALGTASLTGSRALTLTAVIGWQTAATTLLYSADGLGAARQALLQVALSHLRPGTAFGAADAPGSSSALPGFVLPMSTGVAVAVALGWALVPTVVGAWRVRTQDA